MRRGLMRSVEWLDRRLGVPSPPTGGTPGDPGLFGPASTVWRLGRERVLLVGGPAALLMQLAHPLVAAAVARHSEFRHDPMRRLRGTLQAVLAITFGDRPQAEEAAAAVLAVHVRVRGTTTLRVGPYPPGTRYEASDPVLLAWTTRDEMDASVRELGAQAPDLFRRHHPIQRSVREVFETAYRLGCRLRLHYSDPQPYSCADGCPGQCCNRGSWGSCI